MEKSIELNTNRTLKQKFHLSFRVLFTIFVSKLNRNPFLMVFFLFEFCLIWNAMKCFETLLNAEIAEILVKKILEWLENDTKIHDEKLRHLEKLFVLCGKTCNH